VRNVPSFIPYWVEWNLFSGVDFFYFFDDCSDDELTQYWLKFYDEQGISKSYYGKYQPDLIPNCTKPNRIPSESNSLNFLFKKAR
jgi:hypothetical protein